nr:MAG TPA: hypothetical protein [Caudoviricetes sp.]
MNIIVTGTKVTLDNRTLAFQKNNLVDTMTITVDTDETWQYKLDVKYPRKDGEGDELYNVIDLPREGNTCTAIMRASMLPFNGKYTMQLRGISGDKVYHTDTFDVWVKYSIDPSKVYNPIPSEFYQIEQTVTEQAANAKQSETNAAESAAKAEDAAVHSPLIGENGNWFVWDFEKSEYVDSGKSASTPPITPDTAGKYLTNDGSKAEWEKVESNLFLVHLIQGETGSDGKTTYTVDKTFAEIKTAYDAGKKVELIPPADDQNFIVSVGSAPFEVVNATTKTIVFQSISASPAGVFKLPPWTLGGVPLGIISVYISPDEKVSVQFPFSVDGDTGMPVWEWDMVQKLPQQYVVIVTAGTDGTLSSNNTLDQLQIVMQAYDCMDGIIGSASINAVYNRKFYYMSAGTGTSMSFTATTENGLETLTVSNDGKEGSTDVWTYEVVPLGSSTDISLGLTAATIGQTIKVKAVDTDGKPTAWEAVDMAGGETWEKIAEIVIPEGADEATALTINKDSDGNPFRLVKARLCAKFPKYTGATTIPNFSFAMLNGKTVGGVTPLAYTSVWPKVSTSIITGTVYEIDVSGAQQIEHVIKSGTVGWSDDSSRDYAVYGTPYDSDTTWFGDTLWAKPITSIGGAGMLIYPGCRFVLYGVRA